MNKMMGACTPEYRLIQTISLINDPRSIQNYVSNYDTVCFQETRSKRFSTSQLTHTEYALTTVGKWMA